MNDRGNDLALVEAALFLASQPMTRRGLAKVLGDVQLSYVDQLLEDLAETYGDASRGIELLVDDGRATLRVKRDYIERVAHLAPQQDIPRPILRTLAVIAYNQPVTQADVIRVRGNKGYEHIRELIERGLVRSEEHGRTFLLHVTNEFLRHFGLSSAEELKFHAPPIADLQIGEEAEQVDTPSPEGEAEAPEASREAGHEDVDTPSLEGEAEASEPNREARDESDIPEEATDRPMEDDRNASAEGDTDETDALQSDDPGGI